MRILDLFRKKRAGAALAEEPAHQGMEFVRPEPTEKTRLKRAAEYGKLYGTEKRIRMLRDEYDDCTALLALLRNGAGEPEGAESTALEEKRAAIGEESRRAAEKRVLGDLQNLGLLEFGEAVIFRCPSGVLEVALPVTIRDGKLASGTVIDGTVTGEIRSGGQLVGGIWLPLPLKGIGTGEWILKGLCLGSPQGDGGYVLRIGDQQKLWIMEE